MSRGSGVSGNRGFALMVVIVIMLLVSFLASQLSLHVRSEARTVANTNYRTTGRMLAESGVNLALFRLLDKPAIGTVPVGFGEEPFTLGRTYETVLPTGKIEYYAVNETGKINLNSNSTGLLEAFLEYKGLDPDEISVVVDSLQDWRDGDSLHRINGAEEDYYLSLDPPYKPRNGNLQDPAEFFLIKGTEKLRGLFDPYEVFGVGDTGEKINLESLTPAMVDFLAEGDEERISRYQALKGSVPKMTQGDLQSILGEERYASLSRYLGSGMKSNRCSIVATGYPRKGKGIGAAEEDAGTSEYGPGVVLRVLVELSGNSFANLTWRERYL